MRRKDREVLEPAAVFAIIEAADRCVMAMVDETGPEVRPYVVAMNYGFEPAPDGTLTGVFWLHCARQGRKLDVLRRNPHVCIELDGDHEPVKNALGCGWGMKYASVIARGRATIVEDRGERIRGLDSIMRNYIRLWGSPPTEETPGAPMNPNASGTFEEDVLARTIVIRVDVETISAKRKS